MTPAATPGPEPSPESASAAVLTTLFRALAVLRVLVLAYATVVNLGRMDQFAHPGLAWLAIVVMVLWSGLMTWAYDSPARRRLPLYVADLAVAALLVLSTPLVQSQSQLDHHAAHLPTFWIMAAALAWAIGRGWAQGLVAALLLSACDLSIRTSITATTIGNIFLLLLGAGMLGYAVDLLKEAVEIRAAAERTAIATRERQALARVVHDGVLQVLAIVQKRGTELGGEAAELGRLAGEQEARLRAFVQHEGALPEPTGEVDLAAELGRLGTSTVTVALPPEPVMMPAARAGELVAVVGACLSNVRHHVGRDAPAWVLLEAVGDHVVVSVRDEGPGIPEGRLESAASEGRLGVVSSIRGRIEDLSGSAVLTTAPGQGTEWELTVPRG